MFAHKLLAYLLILYYVFLVHNSIDTKDFPTVWTGALCWRQMIWWKDSTLIAVGWDTMSQKDIVCELEISAEDGANSIAIR